MYGAIQLSRLEKNVCAFFRLKTSPGGGAWNPYGIKDRAILLQKTG